MEKNVVVKNGFVGRLFPKPPSQKTIMQRRRESSRRIVSELSSGSYLLQKASYGMKKDYDAKREWILKVNK